jgi:hypothetical protein
LLNQGYQYRETIYFTSSGQFVKADYPWLRAIRVRCQGGGGGGGNAAATGSAQAAAGSGGAGGAYAESFITDIAGLDASVDVTRGGGGGAASNGVNSSFGSLVVADGGVAGFAGGADANLGYLTAGLRGANGGGTGDIIVPSKLGTVRQYGVPLVSLAASIVISGSGQDSFLGTGGAQAVNAAGSAASGFGGGGSGAANGPSTGGRLGGAGSNGIVIVDLFA